MDYVLVNDQGFREECRNLDHVMIRARQEIYEAFGRFDPDGSGGTKNEWFELDHRIRDYEYPVDEHMNDIFAEPLVFACPDGVTWTIRRWEPEGGWNGSGL